MRFLIYITYKVTRGVSTVWEADLLKGSMWKLKKHPPYPQFSWIGLLGIEIRPPSRVICYKIEFFRLYSKWRCYFFLHTGRGVRMHYTRMEPGVLNSVGLLLFRQLPTKLTPHLVYTLAEFINWSSLNLLFCVGLHC